MERKTSSHHVRVYAAFKRQWPDRTPVCEQVFACDVASEILGRNVCTAGPDLHYAQARAWLKGESAHREFLDKLLEDSIALCRHFDFDIFLVPRLLDRRPTRQIDEYTILHGDEDTDEWAIYTLDPKTKTYSLTQSGGPDPTVEIVVDDIRRELACPGAEGTPILDTITDRATSEYAGEFVVASPVRCFPSKSVLGGPWREAMTLQPELVRDYLDLQTERHLAHILIEYEAGIRVIVFQQALANDHPGPAKVGPVDMFDERMGACWKRIFEFCRELGMYTVVQAGGSLLPFADELFGQCKPHACWNTNGDVEMGFDKLRAQFPELVLMGGVGSDILVRGTAGQIEEMVRQGIDTAAPGTITTSSDGVRYGTPVENVYALYETAKRYKPLGRPSSHGYLEQT